MLARLDGGGPAGGQGRVLGGADGLRQFGEFREQRSQEGQGLAPRERGPSGTVRGGFCTCFTLPVLSCQHLSRSMAPRPQTPIPKCYGLRRVEQGALPLDRC